MTKGTGQRKRTVAVHTQETLLARTEEVGQCRIWTGYAGNNTPQVCHEGKLVMVRRLMLALAGKPLGTNQYAGTSCDNPLCIDPTHIKVRSSKQHAQAMAKNVNFHCVVRLKKIAMNSRERRSKITEEQAAEIRVNKQPAREIAGQYGISKSLVCKIRRGDTWRDFGSMWAQLGSRKS